MAESAANLRANLDLKPSVLEVFSSNSLNAMIHPAFKRIVWFLATSKPEKYGWLSQYCEEVYFVINGALQIYYIKAKDASFSENFYGLQRTPAGSKSKLTITHKTLSLIFLITLPYLNRKLEEKVYNYKMQRDEGTLENGIKGFCKKSIIHLYAMSQVVYHTSNVFQILSYISGKSEHQTIPLRLLNLKLAFPSEVDTTGFWMSLLRNELTPAEILSKLLPNIIKSGFEISAFFVQFLQVWQTEQSNRDLTALPVVTPPKLNPKSTECRQKCPICLQSLKTPSAIPVSGFVFCFSCIYKHVMQNKSCPVTHAPVTVDNIIRLYE